MKMNVGTRVLFTVFMILVIFLAAFLICVAFIPVCQTYLLGFVNTLINGNIGYLVLYIIIFAVIIIAAIRLMFFGVVKSSEAIAKIAQFESGTIVITVKAIEELVEKYVRETKAIKGIRSKVLSYNSFINIFVEINVLPDSDIPEITKSLQTNLAEHISKHTGLYVKETKITVLATNDRISALQ